ncbi:MAG: HEAT repeat domain-containing protein, partial [Candidatus Odinarchaeota archaeon]
MTDALTIESLIANSGLYIALFLVMIALAIHDFDLIDKTKQFLNKLKKRNKGSSIKKTVPIIDLLNNQPGEPLQIGTKSLSKTQVVESKNKRQIIETGTNLALEQVVSEKIDKQNNIETGDSINQMIKRLLDSSKSVRYKTIDYLVIRGKKDVEVVEQLIKALEGSSDYRIRSYSAIILGSIMNDRAIDPLARSLNDNSPAVRSEKW